MGEDTDWVTVRLVPVEVFGAIGMCPTPTCPQHDFTAPRCQGCGEDIEECYGLCDAVSSWSDCNRAEGHIFRVDEDWSIREPGETVEIRVRRSDLPLLTEKVWGEASLNRQ